MNIESLNMVCPDCTEWFDSTKLDYTLEDNVKYDGFRHVYRCTCGQRLDDADECHIQKPYSKIIVDILAVQLYHAKQLVNELESKIEEHGGEQ